MSEKENNEGTTILNNADFAKFVHSDLMNTFLKGKMNKISVDDGAGRKGVIKLNKDGEIKVQITTSETL